MTTAIVVMLALFGIKILWNVAALADALVREVGLTLMPFEPIPLIIAAVLVWWGDETPAYATLILLVGLSAIPGSYAAGFLLGALLKKLRR